MIRLNSRIKLNMPNFTKITEAASVALEQTAEALHTEVVQEQIMPFDTGNLQNESTFVDRSESSVGRVRLVSSVPYARRLYFHPEFNFRKHENPNAKGKWYEDYVPGGMYDTFVQDTFKKIYRRLTGV